MYQTWIRDESLENNSNLKQQNNNLSVASVYDFAAVATERYLYLLTFYKKMAMQQARLTA